MILLHVCYFQLFVSYPIISFEAFRLMLQELEDHFTHRFTFLLNQAKVCYSKGDFMGSYMFADKGEQMMPRSINFKRAKEQAYEGTLIALGKYPSVFPLTQHIPLNFD